MTDTHTLFLDASRLKLRFPSVRGELTVEQLWDLSLTSKSGFDLDTVTRGINAALREVSEESFVTTTLHPSRQGLEVALGICKCIIATKQADQARVLAVQQRYQRRRQLLEALATKEAEELSAASREELLQQLATLDAE